MIAFADCTRDDLGLNSAGFGFYPIILRMEGLKALVQKYFSSYSDLSIVQWRHYEQRTNDRLVKIVSTMLVKSTALEIVTYNKNCDILSLQLLRKVSFSQFIDGTSECTYLSVSLYANSYLIT